MGVFVAQDTMEFNVHSPYYFDFKNVRKDGGDIFGTKNGSSLNITDTFFFPHGPLEVSLIMIPK